MELGVSVNGMEKGGSRLDGDLGGSPLAVWGGGGFESDAAPADGVYGIRTSGAVAAKAAQSFGPCLYFGPSGQRCDRPALEGGFCSKHDPNVVAHKVSVPARVAAASLGILGVLWPYVADLAREIIRWIHAR